MPRLSTNAEQMPRSGIRRIMDLAWNLGQPVIGLHVGEPSFATPDHVRKAAEDALQRGETRYVPNAGITPLRHAISNKVARHNSISASPEQVIVSAGGMQALYVALSATVQSGDEVLIPDPGWPNFAMAVQLLQATPARYPLHPENSFLPDVAELDRRSPSGPGRSSSTHRPTPSAPSWTPTSPTSCAAWPTPMTSGSSPTSATTPSPSTYRTSVPRSMTSRTGSSAASASPRRTP